jgi:hypothetical protein
MNNGRLRTVQSRPRREVPEWWKIAGVFFYLGMVAGRYLTEYLICR